jgi:hypothetical protein
VGTLTWIDSVYARIVCFTPSLILVVKPDGIAMGRPTAANRPASNSTKEFRKGNLQCLGNLLDIDERYVPFAAFDTTDIGPIQATDVSKLLLRHS